MSFIRTATGTHLAMADINRAIDEGDSLRIYDRSGEGYKVSHNAWDEAMRLDIRGVVSALPGYFRVELLTGDSGATMHKEPILAWAINSLGESLAVTAGGISLEASSILVPDGRVIEGDGWTENLEVWMRAQAR